MLSADDLRGMAERGLCPTHAALAAGVSRAQVNRSERRHGVTLPRAMQGSAILRTDHREAVQDMKPLDAVEYLLGVIEAIIAPVDVDVVWNWPGAHLCPQEKRVLRVLALSRLPVSRETLFGALNGDRAAPPMEGDGKIVYVILRRVRRKVAPSGVKVVCHFGIGWTLDAPPGFVWPWAVPQ
jgi:hypothetical protein